MKRIIIFQEGGFYFFKIKKGKKLLAVSPGFKTEKLCMNGIGKLVYYFNSASIFGDTFQIIGTDDKVVNPNRK